MMRPWMLLTLLFLLAGCGGSSSPAANTAGTEEENLSTGVLTDRIRIDLLGYLPSASKVAVLADPVEGFDEEKSYQPGESLELRNAQTHQILMTAVPELFHDGDTDLQSGDRGWRLDFSGATAAGTYYLYDPANHLHSRNFVIGSGVYQETLVQASRTFFYQRSGYAKEVPYAAEQWSDGASHLGENMDDHCLPVLGGDEERNLSGGWYDAGDFNKYVNFADGALHNLLFAYAEGPEAWGDDHNIPESGNGIPDILDEIAYELAWMLRMQEEEGGVLHKVSSLSWDATTPPSTDTVPRRYAPVTASATVSAAGAFAHGALVFREFNATLAASLEAGAVAAWSWLEANPDAFPSAYDNQGFVNADAEDSGSDQKANRLAASVYLYALTGESGYHDYLEANLYDHALFMSDDGWLAYDGVDEEVQNALVYYASLEGADPELAAAIRNRYLEQLENPYADFAPLLQQANDQDLYLAYIDSYYWGSSRAKSQAGNVAMNPVAYGFAGENAADLETLAGHFLHYLHGVNPMHQLYLSNMADYGGERSVDQFYHMWFRDGSQWDSVNDSYGPPPGYVVGGANGQYDVAGVLMASGNRQIKDQPEAKAYWNWNTVDDASYEITENSITYQAAYLRLLSKFVE